MNTVPSKPLRWRNRLLNDTSLRGVNEVNDAAIHFFWIATHPKDARDDE